MRDPALGPPKRQSLQWTGGARKVPEEGRRVFPLQGWAFILGFIAFPLWWLAAVLPLEWGWGHLSKQDGKGVWSEEEIVARQVIEYDGKRQNVSLSLIMTPAFSCISLEATLSTYESRRFSLIRSYHCSSCCFSSSWMTGLRCLALC